MFRIISWTVGEMYWILIWKSPGFVPFGDNLTCFRHKYGHPGWESWKWNYKAISMIRGNHRLLNIFFRKSYCLIDSKHQIHYIAMLPESDCNMPYDAGISASNRIILLQLQWNSHNFTSDNGTHRVSSPLGDSDVFFLYFTTKLTLYYFTLFVCKHRVTSPYSQTT